MYRCIDAYMYVHTHMYICICVSMNVYVYMFLRLYEAIEKSGECGGQTS